MQAFPDRPEKSCGLGIEWIRQPVDTTEVAVQSVRDVQQVVAFTPLEGASTCDLSRGEYELSRFSCRRLHLEEQSCFGLFHDEVVAKSVAAPACGRQIGDQSVELTVGSRGTGLARPVTVLLQGQPTFPDSGAEPVGDLLPIRVGSLEIVILG
jgi:hypothetical protein